MAASHEEHICATGSLIPAIALYVCLQVALQLMLRGADDLERAAASHLMHSFCHANALGQTAVLSTLAASREFAHRERQHVLVHMGCLQWSSSSFACVNICAALPDTILLGN
jgi:hypothetical protein